MFIACLFLNYIEVLAKDVVGDYEEARKGMEGRLDIKNEDVEDKSFGGLFDKWLLRLVRNLRSVSNYSTL